jgi:ankyrin repeat protein
MSASEPIPYSAPLETYEQRARELFDALTAGEETAAWRFKWQHPRFRGKTADDVRAATLDLADAQLVIARDYGFENWSDLAAFVVDVSRDGPVATFERAVEAIVTGDAATLRRMIGDNPALIRARSARRHHATLLHYIAANGVEDARQKTPANAVEIARILLVAGAEVDALADMYDAKCTTMSMLVSSDHPAKAGLQVALAELLLDYGAALNGPGSNWQSTLLTALAFGFPDTAEALARRGAPIDNLPSAAGLGRVEDTARLLPDADSLSRHVALALAALHGHATVVRLLLDAGEDPSRLNPEGYHSHSTPLHQAVLSNNADVVHLLVDRGARLDVKDTVYGGTPLDWAIYGERAEMAEYLRGRGAPSS